jgi:hypothetical protein
MVIETLIVCGTVVIVTSIGFARELLTRAAEEDQEEPDEGIETGFGDMPIAGLNRRREDLIKLRAEHLRCALSASSLATEANWLKAKEKEDAEIDKIDVELARRKGEK